MNYTDIPGNSQSIDTIYGPAVAEAKDGDVFVELGVYYGRSLAMLATYARNAGKSLFINGFDWWEDGAVVTRYASHPYEPAPMSECRRYIRECGLDGERLVLDRTDTARAAEMFADGGVTLAFIDGDHSYEGCRRDIAAWRSKIKSKGLLAGHDFSAEYPGVMQAVLEAFPEYVHWGSEFGDTGICWVVRMP
jgi:hypothetical protein